MWPVTAVLLFCATFPSAENQAPAKKARSETLSEGPRWWGTLSGSARYRYEGYRRDGPAFPYDSWASTLRITLGYESQALKGWSAFAEPGAVVPVGPVDYDVPGLPSQRKPGHPPIVDPLGLALNQGFLRWRFTRDSQKFEFRVGRQELLLNDGRFLSNAAWRQHHQSFDGVSFTTHMSRNWTVRYAFANHVNTVVGRDALDGRSPMATHLADVGWKAEGKVKLSVYGLFVDCHTPALSALSTRTVGGRANGPYHLNRNWAFLYTAEMARQTDFGSNPNRVNAAYGLAELGAAYKGTGVKAGYSLVGAKSATNKLTNPLGHPQNGWTELFFANPGVGSSQGLRARYVNAVGLTGLKGLGFEATFCDYRSDTVAIHYGRELDADLKWKSDDKWEVGLGVGRYWADRLFADALRGWVYTSVRF